MTKITIDDKDYDTDNFSEDQNNIANTLTLGMNTMSILNHTLQSVRAIQQLKTNELKESLALVDDAQSELKLW